MALIDKEAALADMDYYISAKKLIEDILEARRIETETVPKLIRLIKAQPRRGTNTGDLVSRQEVLEELTVTEEMDTAELLWTLTTRINDLPNIEPEPRRGWWQYVYKWAESEPCSVCCSVCERQYKIITRYCPNCGARMEDE